MKKKIQKPFDVEAAKRGAVIETRNGHSVRILCYDRVGGSYPIVSLININGTESCATYTIDGKLLGIEFGNHGDKEDLVIVEEVEETKFSTGDWIFKSEYPFLITAVNSGFYRIQDTRGYTAELNRETIDKFYHLWALDDARSGDVLVCKDDNRPFIFKEDCGGAPSAYCGIDTTDSIYIGTDGPWTRTTVRPATSNEKDMLFKKMEEEGYKWDANSLTLSKIQKRWRDDEHVQIDGYFMNGLSQIVSRSGYNTCCYYNLFATERQAKSAMAMARISQIMANDERFGGVITDKEWGSTIPYFVIAKVNNMLTITTRYCYEYLAFHTKEQAELFLEENEDLIKMYYMID